MIKMAALLPGSLLFPDLGKSGESGNDVDKMVLL